MRLTSKYYSVLFEMPTYSYLKTGEMIGSCTTLGKKWKNENKGE